MTREEAISFGNMWLELNEDAEESETYQFFKMAISALSAPSANVISIDQANAMIKSYISHYEENKGEWIPVSERLPEKNRAVLTYVDTGASKTYCLAYWKGEGEGWEEWIGYRMVETEMGYKVLAWQPLPEPYKTEKGGE